MSVTYTFDDLPDVLTDDQVTIDPQSVGQATVVWAAGSITLSSGLLNISNDESNYPVVVHASGNAVVRAFGNVLIHAAGESEIHAWGTARVMARQHAAVHAYNSTHVQLLEQATGELCDDATGIALDSAHVEVSQRSVLEAYDAVTLLISQSARVTMRGRCQAHVNGGESVALLHGAAAWVHTTSTNIFASDQASVILDEDLGFRSSQQGRVWQADEAHVIGVGPQCSVWQGEQLVHAPQSQPDDAVEPDDRERESELFGSMDAPAVDEQDAAAQEQTDEVYTLPSANEVRHIPASEPDTAVGTALRDPAPEATDAEAPSSEDGHEPVTASPPRVVEGETGTEQLQRAGWHVLTPPSGRHVEVDIITLEDYNKMENDTTPTTSPSSQSSSSFNLDELFGGDDDDDATEFQIPGL